MKNEPQWEDCPRHDGGEHAWTMVQTPPRGRLEIVCLSPRITGCWVHFWNNRTLGCTGDQCEACSKNRAKFWEGYIAALRSPGLDRLIVRITEKVGGQINQWLSSRTTLRGARMELDRPSRTPNGRIRIIIQETLADVPERIIEPAMRPLLCHIWRFNQGGGDGAAILPKRQPDLPGQKNLLDFPTSEAG
jgi:hypothetical protein